MRVFVIGLLSLVMFQLSIPFASADVIRYWLNFATFRDEYRMDFTYPTGTTSYTVNFLTPSNVPYEIDFNVVPTGILYLTCNGTYSVDFFDSGDNRIGFFEGIVTTAIVTPSCSSYPDQTGSNALGATSTPNSNGGHDLSWDAQAGVDKYEIYQDGVKIGETTGTSYNIPSDGSVSIVAKDANGDIIAQSDLHVPELGAVDNLPESGTCNGCQFLKDMLACPDWDTYMGELTGAMQAALPPPPDWAAIADQIGAATVSHLSNYLGAVPPAPSQTLIDAGLTKPMPAVSTAVYESEILVPTVPSGFETKIPFDIDAGQEIEIVDVDESVPFQIFEPLHNMEFDDVGIPVFPNDPRNTTGGIKLPDQLVIPMPSLLPMPTTAPIPTPSPFPIPSAAPMPQPSYIPYEIPIPEYKG